MESREKTDIGKSNGAGGPATRRKFFGATLLGTGVLGAAAAAFGGLITGLLQPLHRRQPAGADDTGTGAFLFVTRFENLPEDGTAMRFPVITDPVDAWTRYQSRSIGNVFLRRVKAGTEPVDRMDPSMVAAWNARCPHAGCTVNFRRQEMDFFCHCHESRFLADGSLPGERSHSPRPLDSLEVQIRGDGEIWIRFQQFQVGTPEKKPLT